MVEELSIPLELSESFDLFLRNGIQSAALSKEGVPHFLRQQGRERDSGSFIGYSKEARKSPTICTSLVK